MSYLRTLITSRILFAIIILLNPLSCIAGFFDDEERRTFRSPTPLQSLVDNFRHEVDCMGVLFSPDDITSMIQGFVVTYMREQGFTITSELRGPQSNVSVKGEDIIERKAQYKRAMKSALRAPTSLSEYTQLMNSPVFGDVLEDEAYILLLQEWLKKLSPEAPYTDCLPNLFLRKGMIVFCPHPRDVSASSEFLSLLYNALKHLRDIERKDFVPDHEGLKQVFKTFEEHQENKEDVLSLWGASILKGTERFYKEQRVLFGWEYVDRVFALTRRKISTSCQELNTELSLDLIWLENLEDLYFLPEEQRLKNTLRIEDNPLETIKKTLETWQNLLKPAIKEAPTNQQLSHSAKKDVCTEQMLEETIRRILRKIDRCKLLSIQLEEIEGDYSLTQYFSNRRGIQFSNPFQVRKELGDLSTERLTTSPTGLSSLNPVYQVFGELLSFTHRQMRVSTYSIDYLLTRLPPLSLVPREHREKLKKAYKKERQASIEVLRFSKQERQTREAVVQFEKSILDASLPKLDTRDKLMLRYLQDTALRNPLSEEEQEVLKNLKKAIIEKELELPSSQNTYLNLKQTAHNARLAHEMFRLKHHKALLNLDYIRHSFVSWVMKANDVEKERRASIDEKRRELMAKFKKTTDAISQKQATFHMGTDLPRQTN